MSLHRFMLSTHCFKATVPSIRFFNWQKIGLIFCLINWQLTLTGGKQNENYQGQLHGVPQ